MVQIIHGDQETEQALWHKSKISTFMSDSIKHIKEGYGAICFYSYIKRHFTYTSKNTYHHMGAIVMVGEGNGSGNRVWRGMIIKQIKKLKLNSVPPSTVTSMTTQISLLKERGGRRKVEKVGRRGGRWGWGRRATHLSYSLAQNLWLQSVNWVKPVLCSQYQMPSAICSKLNFLPFSPKVHFTLLRWTAHAAAVCCPAFQREYGSQ